jgi:hypothetical protein
VSDTKLIVAFALLHLAALAAGGGLLLLALRSGDASGQPHRPGWGNRPPDQPQRPIGGPPLPSATPARVRLRGPGRLAHLHPPPRRRAPNEPKRPAPRPAGGQWWVGH